MKKLLILWSLLLLVVSYSSAQTIPVTTTINSSSTGPTTFNSDIGGISISYTRVGTSDVMSLTWRPDFKYGFWSTGFDVNVALGANKTTDYQNVVFRYVEYDDTQKGLRYGVLDGVTIGHGLIMKNYTTRKGPAIMLNNDQLGFKGHLDFDRYVVRGMATKSNLYYARVEERINPMLTLGQYYVTDTTGRTISLSGSGVKQYPSVSAVGLDALMPLPLNFEGYAEAGQILNHGSGVSAGLSWAYDLMVANASLSVEYRIFDKGFVPGYFGSEYEFNPIDLASVEAASKPRNGFLAQFGLNALGLAKLGVAYESYTDSNSALSVDLTAKLNEQVFVRGYCSQPNFVDFRSLSLEQGAVMGADVAYKLNANTSLITHFKKQFNSSTGQVEEAQYYEISLSF
ncbi:hypothetical protein A3K48_00190 [candidate division WOR-1 bacterium RIFOXYA12_FULL_52_29]|uniref:Uncharacterized protein n=1 Tax=candidate division WOR-1 bacterium RIFOXYC12_FULL_54_18 TaxID=1802584 RepID=A0A1F4T3R3_UNCSA|nr:MAG: hypothetical protein A3K44_00190 [candidate division WOR-1 bacterium RIFOXYA2_FULL_51_19]OGC17024.1 MAG: hypothetical protein A3K48_00190 [candidate division WOR-1 bacterium RIFOXYA12_FULL_52_29]OGC25885.1 MAG: hypothetical protein A3K32_00190 [candidate division WOR-1 bacterium RIFOXYB2_FULL_45_9]OGC27441.1 MAG: hypothetical protein A3K49_00190 [candidate division WOR-1 bacterium RIFOXYC12_FULL_54_18]OGC29346.1 MAG: hypothetical protein A2346_01515 [candidate division WOR-1 bacterium R